MSLQSRNLVGVSLLAKLGEQRQINFFGSAVKTPPIDSESNNHQTLYWSQKTVVAAVERRPAEDEDLAEVLHYSKNTPLGESVTVSALFTRHEYERKENITLSGH
jgi:hypothetical protein